MQCKEFTHQGEVFVGVHLVESDELKCNIRFGFVMQIGIPTDKARTFVPKPFSQVDSSTTLQIMAAPVLGLTNLWPEKLVRSNEWWKFKLKRGKSGI